MTIFDWLLLFVGIILWLLYFGLESALNGGTSHGSFFKMIYMCLKQDLSWLLNRNRIKWATEYVDQNNCGIPSFRYRIKLTALDLLKYFFTNNSKYINDRVSGEEIVKNKSLALKHANAMLPSKIHIINCLLFPFAPLMIYHFTDFIKIYLDYLQYIHG